MFGRKPRLIVRPSGDALPVFTKGDDREYHRSDPGGRLIVATATEASEWSDWRTVYTSEVDVDSEAKGRFRSGLPRP